MKTQEFTDIEPDDLIPLSNFLEVPASGCKWPYEDMLCCGRIRDGKSQYCEAHHRRANPGKGKNPDPLPAAGWLSNAGKPSGKRLSKPRPIMTILIGDIG